jgi:hypothetical protein
MEARTVPDTPRPVDDIVEIEQVLARYALAVTKEDVPAIVAAFAPDGTYTAFGATHGVAELPAYLGTAPHGLLHPAPAAIEVLGDEARGEQSMVFIDQGTHDMRLGYWTDRYVRTHQGWRILSREMTFLRRSGDRDGGKTVPTTPSTP